MNTKGIFSVLLSTFSYYQGEGKVKYKSYIIGSHLSTWVGSWETRVSPAKYVNLGSISSFFG